MEDINSMDSSWSPCGVHSIITKHAILLDPTWTPSGLHLDLCGFHLDSMDSRWSPGGIQLKSVKAENKHILYKLIDLISLLSHCLGVTK
jgi:hypothetical protein